MLEFREVTKGYAGETLLEGVSFKINPGEKCGLVGRNGAGKTTLLRLATGEEQSDGGDILVPKGYRLGYLTQHIRFTHPTLLEETVAALPPLEREEVYKAEKILFGLGFGADQMGTDPTSFSGGYQLRIHLAKVLVAAPDCLLLDEPTNYLDILSIRWFIRFLQAWRGEMVLISHDREFMDCVTTHICGIQRKKVHKIAGKTEKFYAHILQTETLHEQTRLNLEKKKAHLQDFINRFGAKASKASQAQARRKALARIPVLEELALLHNLDFTFPYAPLAGEAFVRLSHVSFGYGEKGNPPVVKDFSLDIQKQDRIAIIGKNGQGKSTLLRLLAQELIPQKGEVRVAPPVRLGFFGQTNIERLQGDLTIEEEIRTAAPHLSYAEVRRVCGIMLFSGEQAKKKVSVLSGGEKSRVLLGKLLASPANLLLLDEPTNHLDMEAIEALGVALQLFEGAVVLVTHSEGLLRQIPQKLVICTSTRQECFEGDYQAFLEQRGWEEEKLSLSPKKEGHETWKENKKKAVERVTQRSRILLPLQKKIQGLETEISHLEVALEKEIEALLQATRLGTGEEIAVLARSVEKKKEEIEQRFSELTLLTETFERSEKEIDRLFLDPEA